LFPQPYSWTALENFVVSVSALDDLWTLPHWSGVPWAMWRYPKRTPLGRTYVMPPGGANPVGALGYVSAAFELAEQVRAGEMPEPRCIVVGVGSTCTSAGLLLGLALAARRGVGFSGGMPDLLSVRVTPWPITARFRILRLAERTSRLLASLSGDDSVLVERAELGRHLHISGCELGKGYGIPSPSGQAAMQSFATAGLPALDTTYSSKAAAGFLDRCSKNDDVVLFWSTKSSVPLPATDPARLRALPTRPQRWIREAERSVSSGLPAGYLPIDAIKSA
jgi:1-aminocyclopropane-1-carboxylate deaminase/D-cysteine desulfhydrase-like pyridoxal-dependent ACC family enzyme